MREITVEDYVVELEKSSPGMTNYYNVEYFYNQLGQQEHIDGYIAHRLKGGKELVEQVKVVKGPLWYIWRATR